MAMPVLIVLVLALALVVAVSLNPALPDDLRWLLVLLAIAACILALIASQLPD